MNFGVHEVTPQENLNTLTCHFDVFFFSSEVLINFDTMHDQLQTTLRGLMLRWGHFQVLLGYAWDKHDFDEAVAKLTVKCLYVPFIYWKTGGNINQCLQEINR